MKIAFILIAVALGLWGTWHAIRKREVIGGVSIVISLIFGIVGGILPGNSASEAMHRADDYYRAGEYQKVLDKYAEKAVASDARYAPLANTNRGFLYSKEEFGMKNIDESILCYDAAIEQGYARAASNKLAVCLREMRLDEAIAAIASGDKLNNELIANWIAAYRGVENDDNAAQYEWFLHTMNADEQKQFIVDMHASEMGDVTLEDFYDGIGPERQVGSGVSSYRPFPSGASVAKPTYCTYRIEIQDQNKLEMLDEEFITVDNLAITE